jgi:hypothetical protein
MESTQAAPPKRRLIRKTPAPIKLELVSTTDVTCKVNASTMTEPIESVAKVDMGSWTEPFNYSPPSFVPTYYDQDNLPCSPTYCLDLPTYLASNPFYIMSTDKTRPISEIYAMAELELPPRIEVPPNKEYDIFTGEYTDRQDNTRQSGARRDYTRPSETRQDNTRPSEDRRDYTRSSETRQDNTRRRETRQDNTRPSEDRRDYTRSSETRQDYTRSSEDRRNYTRSSEDRRNYTKPRADSLDSKYHSDSQSNNTTFERRKTSTAKSKLDAELAGY